MCVSFFVTASKLTKKRKKEKTLLQPCVSFSPLLFLSFFRVQEIFPVFPL